MSIVSLLLLLSLSAKSNKSELDGKWGIAYFETPVDSVLLAGNPNLVLEGMCYGSNHGSNYGSIYGPEYRDGPIFLEWSDNGFIIQFNVKNEKRVHVNAHVNTIAVKSYTIGPGKFNGDGFGGDFKIKVLSKKAVISWRDDHDEISYDISVNHDRATLYIYKFNSRSVYKKHIISRMKKTFGTCKSINY